MRVWRRQVREQNLRVCRRAHWVVLPCDSGCIRHAIREGPAWAPTLGEPREQTPQRAERGHTGKLRLQVLDLSAPSSGGPELGRLDLKRPNPGELGAKRLR